MLEWKRLGYFTQLSSASGCQYNVHSQENTLALKMKFCCLLTNVRVKTQIGCGLLTTVSKCRVNSIDIMCVSAHRSCWRNQLSVLLDSELNCRVFVIKQRKPNHCRHTMLCLEIFHIFIQAVFVR